MSLSVLMIVASEDDGGMARVAWLLAKHLAAFDVAVRVVAHREAPFTAWLAEAGIPFDIVPELVETPTRPRPDGRTGLGAVVANLRGLPVAARRIREIAARYGSRVLYTHNTWSHYVGAAAVVSARRASAAPAVVWHIHNDHSRPMTRLLDRAAIRAASVAGIVAVSRSIGEPFEGLAAPLTVATNGIERPVCEAARARPLLRARLGLDRRAIVAVYAGRLVAHKGIHVLMDAALSATAEVPDLHVAILGGTPRHDRDDVLAALRARAAASGVAGRVHLPGHVDDVERWVADADVAVVPSTCADGCPLAAIEALCLGVPVVGSAVGGLPEIIRDGVDGLLVPPGDSAALAGALVTLARQPDRRRLLARAASDAAERFDAVRMTARVADVLHTAARRAPPSR